MNRKDQGSENSNILIAILVAVIVGSIITIATRFWKSNNAATTQNEVSSDHAPIVQSNPLVQLLEPDEQVAPEFKPITPEIESKFRERGIMPLAATPACSDPKWSQEKYLTGEIGALSKKVARGEFNFYMGDRVDKCYRVNSRVSILLFDRTDPTAKFIQNSGSVRIKQIFRSPVEKIPNILFDSLSIERARHKILFPSADPDTIIVYDDFQPALSSEMDFFPIFPYTARISQEHLGAIKNIYANRYVLDVRIAAEREKKPIEGSIEMDISIPLNLDGMKVSNLTRNDINSIQVKLIDLFNRIENREGNAVIIVGSGERDLRAAALAIALKNSTPLDIFWLPLM